MKKFLEGLICISIIACIIFISYLSKYEITDDKKQLEFSILNLGMDYSQNDKNNDNKENLNVNEYIDIKKELNQKVEQYTFDNAIKSGYVIRKTINGSEEKNEVYNNKKLEEFVKKVKEKKADNITIVEYLNKNSNFSINKLTEVKYDGQDITVNYYDVFTDKKDFKISDKMNFKDINMREINNALIYSFSNNKNEDIKLVSFKKSEIKN